MNYKLKVSFDIDGVLADFDFGYLKRFKKWPQHDWAITRNVNYILSKEPEFWINLPILNRLDFIPCMYCSARVNSEKLTKQYLIDNDFPEAPLFQIPGYKFSKAGALRGRCDVHIEDSVKNFLDLNSKGIPCLLYSNKVNSYLGPALRIYSLDYAEIEEVYYLGQMTGIFKDFKQYYDC